MFIKNFGLFWRADEIDWNPGKGRRGAFRLLGRRGAHYPTLKMADFRHQQGIYILYGNHGPHYVGLTRRQGLGKRLKDHLYDQHADCWDRFSWFGFCTILKKKDENGFRCLRPMPESANHKPNELIGDVEAMLIRAMGLRNINQNRFRVAREWEQVKLDQVKTFTSRLW